ncbi:ABC transporter permease [Paenibacillus cymbidii]|uniref:ABC transporter permease n=1 Tax=Paenibacillus cymbidii TaxID=1639034 RepID=UPI00107FEB99|nr:ABC transporter permease subunit [Paenibacillus cymbidii]
MGAAHTTTTAQSPPFRSRPRDGNSWKRILARWQLYALLVPPLVYLALFKYIPMYGVQIAFRQFLPSKGMTGSDWVGWRQFDRFFHSNDFWTVMNNTIGLSFYHLLANFPFPILLALSLHYVANKRFKKTVQMVTYAPHFISVVVLVGIVMQVLDPRVGIVNHVLERFGAEPVNFMGKAGLFQSIYVWSGVWQHVGFSCIIYLAALSGIDPALHEAAVVDGASKIRRMWHIDLPGIMPIAVILLILNVGNMLDTGFEKVLLMQNPLNQQTSEVIDTYVYKVVFQSVAVNYSYASAIGLFKSCVNLVLLVAVNQIARKLKTTSLW